MDMRLGGQVPFAGKEMHGAAAQLEDSSNLRQILVRISSMLQDAATKDNLKVLIVEWKSIWALLDLFAALEVQFDRRRLVRKADIASIRIVSQLHQSLNQLAGAAAKIENASLWRFSNLSELDDCAVEEKRCYLNVFRIVHAGTRYLAA
jgi:hypothetical protein